MQQANSSRLNGENWFGCNCSHSDKRWFPRPKRAPKPSCPACLGHSPANEEIDPCPDGSPPCAYPECLRFEHAGGLRRYRSPGGPRLGLETGRGCSGKEQRGLRRRVGVEEGSAYSRSPPRPQWPDRVLVRMEACLVPRASCGHPANWGSLQLLGLTSKLDRIHEGGFILYLTFFIYCILV